jgi:GNAT superfamily N-acetyltransferase
MVALSLTDLNVVDGILNRWSDSLSRTNVKPVLDIRASMRLSMVNGGFVLVDNLEDPHGLLWVAYGSAAFTTDMIAQAHIFHVDVSHRNKGIGTELLKTARGICSRDGVNSLYYGQCNEDITSFYKENSLTLSEIHWKDSINGQ